MKSLAFSLLFVLLTAVAKAENLRSNTNRALETSDQDESFHEQALKAADEQEETIVRASLEEPNPNDTGHRFSKFEMVEGKSKPEMKASSYPMSLEVSTMLRFYSNAYSVVTDNDFEMRNHDVTHYIEKVGGYPPRPSKDPQDPYWQQFRYVAETQLLRRDDQLPDDWYPPDLWKGLSAYEVAELVHDEYPGQNQAKLLEYFFVYDRIELDYDILPFRCIDDFIGMEVRLAALNTWAITTVAPINFAAKWHCGQLRPEEMAWLITTDAISKEYVPPDIYKMVKDMKLTNATSFTQYPEGSPLHCSWPAMHSAASSLSLWLPVISKLTEEQYCQVLRTDWAVSYARTIAGVHYPSDNYAGLNMGQEVVSYSLPKHLKEVYGADEEAVRKKIEKYRFDWRNFDPRLCATKVVQPLEPIPQSTPATGSGNEETTAVAKGPETRNGCILKTVDFNELETGIYVMDQYAEYGLTLSANGGFNNRPRIFDTRNPGNMTHGDPDLGSPNESCDGGGPGEGEGGKKSALGENCQPLGNVLIIQEPGNDDMSIPDDNVDGGNVVMKLKGQYVKEIGLLDVDYSARLYVQFDHSSGTALRTMNIPLLGDNSYQVIDIDIEGVRSMTLELSRSGAISHVTFCPTT